MPYAADMTVSHKEIDGGVEITEQEYNQARDHLISGGMVKVYSGKMILTSKPEKLDGHLEPVWQDGEWYHEPEPESEPTQEELDAQRIGEIDARLKAIDLESLRPLRAIANGTETQADRDKLAGLDAEAEQLRAERATLTTGE